MNADTIFSVQSMSKLFTATAVMQAVAAGRLDLDEPITTYLPGFTVHSAFEEHPERKITLRMLLSHTAGFTHEAPVGNNNELDPGDFDAHVRSISETWLRFPVGTGYAYSNLGIDLAGYILERVEGKPFPEVVRESLLEPLGMERSTFDRAAIRAAGNRAVGHVDPYPEPPLYEPMTAAGGLYASAADLARFLRFQLDGGSIDGRVVLDSKWLDEMRTVPPPHAGAPAGLRARRGPTALEPWDQRPDLLEHGGGGYGFLSDLWWVPQLGIGIAILTNSDDHQLRNGLALSVLADLLGETGVYRDRLLALPSQPPAEDPDGLFEPPSGLASLVANTAMAAMGDEAFRWAGYSGAYRRPVWVISTRLMRRTGSSSTRAFPTSRPKTRDGVARSPPPRRSRARSVPCRQRRDLGPSGIDPDLAEPPARQRLGRSLTMAVGNPRSSRAPRLLMADRRTGAEPPALRHLAILVRASANRDPPVAQGHGGGCRCDRAAHAHNRGPSRVDARARRRRIPELARSVPDRTAGPAPAAGGCRPGRLHCGSCCLGLDWTLVVERGEAALRRPCGRGGCARRATRCVESHWVGHELAWPKRQAAPAHLLDRALKDLRSYGGPYGLRVRRHAGSEETGGRLRPDDNSAGIGGS